MSLKETAKYIGRSLSWTNQARSSFIKNGGLVAGPGSGGRRRSNLSLKEEAEVLEPFIEKAKRGGLLVVRSIHEAVEKKLGRKVSRASAYNLLHRYDWRKLVPDKRHVKADPEVQEEWKKNCQKSSKN
jgi:transposase